MFHSKPKNLNEVIRIKFGSKLPTRVESIKYVGILVDSTLTWKPQISELSKKLARTCGIFFRMRHCVTPEALKLLYYSLFNSFLFYGIVIGGLTHSSMLDCLFKVQIRVIRAISFKDRYTHTTPLFYELKILKLHDIYSLKLLCFVSECTNNSITIVFDSFFNQFQIVHSYNHRQASEGNIYLTGVKTTQYWKNIQEKPSGILFICLFCLNIFLTIILCIIIIIVIIILLLRYNHFLCNFFLLFHFTF